MHRVLGSGAGAAHAGIGWEQHHGAGRGGSAAHASHHGGHAGSGGSHGGGTRSSGRGAVQRLAGEDDGALLSHSHFDSDRLHGPGYPHSYYSVGAGGGGAAIAGGGGAGGVADLDGTGSGTGGGAGAFAPVLRVHPDVLSQLELMLEGVYHESVSTSMRILEMSRVLRTKQELLELQNSGRRNALLGMSLKVAVLGVSLSAATFVTSAFGANLASGLEGVPGLLWLAAAASATMGAATYRYFDATIIRSSPAQAYARRRRRR
jgi:hypothetical protein